MGQANFDDVCSQALEFLDRRLNGSFYRRLDAFDKVFLGDADAQPFCIKTI